VAATPARIELAGAAKVFAARSGATVAFQNVDLAVREGELLCVLGPSGCGKSTLLNVIAGLDSLSHGSVTVAGKPVEGPHYSRGMVFQDYALFPWLTVEENIRFGLDARGFKGDKKTIVSDLVSLTRLQGFERARPAQLSGGMAQRVALARALANQVEILLMDEPFGALDAFTRMEMQEEIVRIVKAQRVTTVFVTHDIDEALYVGDRVAIMSAHPGELRQVIPVPISHPRDRLDPKLVRLRELVFTEFNLAHSRGQYYQI
jgi:ABC-type nitrate/sulfonate/bicarbonate transport system ATPase subunit